MSDKYKCNTPDYSAYKDKFEFYCYAPPNDGTWISDDGEVMYAGEDFRSVERYKEYKECGFDILMMQTAGKYEGEEWETSNAKAVMDKVYAAGIRKIIMTDIRLQKLSAMEGGLLGEGKPFVSEAELDAYVAECLSPYRDHPGFYGVQLKDEPYERHKISYGQAYRSIKRVCPDCFVQIQLNQIYTNEANFKHFGEVVGTFESEEAEGRSRYQKYVADFIDGTGSDYMMFDTYPLKGDGIRPLFIYNMQVFARICAEKGVRFAATTQTESELAVADKRVKMRKVTEAGARWLNNIILGFGAKQIVYYTYFNKGRENASIYPDGTSFITHDGKRTELYYFMKKIIAENQRFAPVILQFEYVTSEIYTLTPTVYPCAHTVLREECRGFTALASVQIDKECALVTELFDKKNERYMYMVQNIVDPQFQGANALQTAYVSFKQGYTRALVFVNGERTERTLQDGKLILKQNAGEAAFIIPY